MVRVLVVFVCSCFSTTTAFPQFRKYSNEFLHIGAGGRGLGMGGAQTASSSDGTAGYWNPAGLTRVRTTPLLSLMHAEYFAGIGKYDFGSLVFPLADQKRTLGLSFLRFAVDDIPNTLYLVEPDGSLNYNNIRSFSSADQALLLTYSHTLRKSATSTLSIGVNTKIIHRLVGRFANAWGFGFDAGVQYRSARWSIGAVIRDMTTTFNVWNFNFTDREKEILYLTQNNIPLRSTEQTAPRLSIGVAYMFGNAHPWHLLAEGQLDLTFDGKRNVLISAAPISADPRIGLELDYRSLIFFRAGVYNFQKALADADTMDQRKVWIYQPGAGAGFKLKQIGIDYAFTNLANQSNPLFTHIVSLQINLEKKERKPIAKSMR